MPLDLSIHHQDKPPKSFIYLYPRWYDNVPHQGRSSGVLSSIWVYLPSRICHSSTNSNLVLEDMPAKSNPNFVRPTLGVPPHSTASEIFTEKASESRNCFLSHDPKPLIDSGTTELAIKSRTRAQETIRDGNLTAETLAYTIRDFTPAYRQGEKEEVVIDNVQRAASKKLLAKAEFLLDKVNSSQRPLQKILDHWWEFLNEYIYLGLIPRNAKLRLQANDPTPIIDGRVTESRTATFPDGSITVFINEKTPTTNTAKIEAMAHEAIHACLSKCSCKGICKQSVWNIGRRYHGLGFYILRNCTNDTLRRSSGFLRGELQVRSPFAFAKEMHFLNIIPQNYAQEMAFLALLRKVEKRYTEFFKEVEVARKSDYGIIKIAALVTWPNNLPSSLGPPPAGGVQILPSRGGQAGPPPSGGMRTSASREKSPSSSGRVRIPPTQGRQPKKHRRNHNSQWTRARRGVSHFLRNEHHSQGPRPSNTQSNPQFIHVPPRSEPSVQRGYRQQRRSSRY